MRDGPPVGGQDQSDADRVVASRDAYVAQVMHVHLPPLPPPPTPRELPLDVTGFVGRGLELELLDELLAAGKMSSTVVISAVSGTAGVGKTALATRWAHRVADQFPDGQLYVDLRGFDPDRPMPAGDALAAFLRAMGVAPESIPGEVSERAARYRSLLAGRRMLVVLDNARSDEQVRLLLPGTASCFVLVTSRDSLAALVARHGAQRIELDLLPLSEAVELLHTLVGARVDSDPDSTQQLVEQCARLPLALRIAAELAVARPAIGLDRLVAELADEHHRLDLLHAGGDPRTAVRAVFSWSYRYLPAEAARTFRLLGLLPGHDFDHYAVSALIGAELGHAAELISVLTRAHLLQEPSPDRYSMHDLLHTFASELALQKDPGAHREGAVTRLFDYYLATAATAMNSLSPADRAHRPDVTAIHTPAAPTFDGESARAWLDAERANLIAFARSAAGHGMHTHVTHLAAVIRRYLLTGAHYGEATELTLDALKVARAQNDSDRQGAALHSLGIHHMRQARMSEAITLFDQALALRREAGDRVGEAMTLHATALASERLNRYADAIVGYDSALAIYRLVGDPIGEATALDNLGMVDARLGHYRDALARFEQALAIARDSGNRTTEAGVVDNIGTVYTRLGRYQDAEANHLRAIAVARQIGYRAGEAEALDNLGVAYFSWQRLDDALDCHEKALVVANEIGDRRMQAKALNGLAETLRTGAQSDSARKYCVAALAIAEDISDRDEQARSHDCMAYILRDAGDLEHARNHWQKALALYTDLGLPEAEQTRSHLATLDEQRSP